MHWGEPTFLDLVEHLADLSRDAPILLLCMARPELLDAPARLGRRQAERDDVLLEPLAADETGELIDERSTDELDGRAPRAIREAAGGNPLFVEEMVAMVAERRRPR